MSDNHTQLKRKSNKGVGRMRYLKKRAYSNSLIANGDVGIFFTCIRGKESMTSYEFKDLLENIAEDIEPNSKINHDQIEPKDDLHQDQDQDQEEEEEEEEEEEDIAVQIEKELKELKGSNRSANNPKDNHIGNKFEIKKMDSECLGFIKFPKDFDPVQFSLHLIQKIQQGRLKFGFKFIQRITPISFSCSSTNLVEFERILIKSLTPDFGIKFHNKSTTEDDGSNIKKRVGLKFRIEPIIRCHDKPLNRSEVIRITGDIINTFNSDEYVMSPDESSVGHDPSSLKHRVCIDDAEVVIVVCVYKYICGISVLRGYDKDGKKFNLRTIAETQERSKLGYQSIKAHCISRKANLGVRIDLPLKNTSHPFKLIYSLSHIYCQVPTQVTFRKFFCNQLRNEPNLMWLSAKNFLNSKLVLICMKQTNNQSRILQPKLNIASD
ncbi:hypothetical protein O181_049607 [Austropuccinia psidii MF-1]|uniref:THUMP domain-containing protein n=1 Tax=Austropuccinia psidii MF-1 TaxID=1389203 RepID=A0A9Q3HMS5_9BASI|nr:hypothetical protein [Austropuccinia psidii MF-1]